MRLLRRLPGAFAGTNSTSGTYPVRSRNMLTQVAQDSRRMYGDIASDEAAERS